MQLSDLPPGVNQFDQHINPTEDDMAYPLRVRCPVCEQPAGQNCVGVESDFDSKVVRYQHTERFEAAELTPEELSRSIR